MSKRKETWYGRPKWQAHDQLCQLVAALRKRQGTYRDWAMFMMKLREGSEDILGEGLYTGSDGRMRYNLCGSAADTMMSIVASARPLPQVVVKGGDWKIQRKAKLRTRTLQSQAIDLDLYELAAQAWDDAQTVGIGAIQFLPDWDNGVTAAERVLPLELVWDWAEATSGKPRSIFRVRLVDREQLAALYENKADAIRKSHGPSAQDKSDFALTRQTDCDQVVLVEAWHLPSSSKAKDGRRVLCTSSVTLADEPWTRPRFPLGIFRYAPKRLGFLGRSIIEETRPAQRRIHSLIEYVEECQDLGSKPSVWVEQNSNVSADQIDNVPMTVCEYGGTPPIFNTFDATPHDLEASIQQIREQTWSALGMNETQIRGEKPSGINSAIGLQTLEDMGSRRHARNLKAFETSMLGCFQAMADVNDDVAAKVPGYEVRRESRGRFLETSKWKELQVSDGDMRIQVFPISALPTTPTGRYEKISEWVNLGWMPRDVAMQLLGLPDLEAYEDLETADLRLAQRQASQILDGEQNVLPDPAQSMAVAADYMRKMYVSQLEDGAPEEILEQLRTYLHYAEALAEEAAAAAQPAQAQPGVGEPPPVEMTGALPPEMAGMAA